MLTFQDLIEIDRIPEENELTLQVLVDYYEQYLCRRVFIFELVNGESVKLFFRDATEIFHVSGIEHIYKGTPMDGTRFLTGIKKGEIDFNIVKNRNQSAYKDFEIRIRSMACIDTVIKNCEYLFFPGGKIPESDIRIKYLLLKGLDEKNIHLGIDTYKKGRPYFAKTLLITEGEQKEKFIDRADERLRVVSLKIEDKDTHEVLLFIERAKATMLAKMLLKEIAQKWIENDFVNILKDYWNNLSENNVSRKQKNIWKQEFMQTIKMQKSFIMSEVAQLDPYWKGKIVGEAIREYEKLNAIEDIEIAIQKNYMNL